MVHRFTLYFTLIMLPALLALGIWQVQRAQQKSLIESAVLQTKAKPLSLRELNHLQDPLLRRVTVRGHFDNKHSLLLDNKVHRHQVGYHVLTPFYPENSDKVLLVNRGWIAGGNRRDSYPALVHAPGLVTITGITRLPSAPIVLRDDKPPSDWPWRVQRIQLPILSGILQQRFYPFVLLLDPDQPHGYVREWQWVNMPAAKHYAYAFQWFALALTLVIINLVIWRKRKQ